MLAALAASTERVELGPLVASTAFHPPGLVARMAATIDEVSSGRFILGLGSGWNEAEFRAFGIPFESKAARFGRGLYDHSAAAGGERVSFAGRFDRVDDAVLLPPPKRPVPLLVGTSGPQVFAASSAHIDYWNCWYAWYGNTPSGFAKLSAAFEGNFRRSACVLVTVGDGGERPPDPTSPPVAAAALREHLIELEAAGADEAILVLDPINELALVTVAKELGLSAGA
jgi:Coenzyme F420-dependent N5,N10-methylene tetrahydromethanopterin reductase and related flavin-dependent oxidoreductases